MAFLNDNVVIEVSIRRPGKRVSVIRHAISQEQAETMALARQRPLDPMREAAQYYAWSKAIERSEAMAEHISKELAHVIVAACAPDA